MKKRNVMMFLAASMTLSLVGCTLPNASKTKETETTSVETVSEETTNAESVSALPDTETVTTSETLPTVYDQELTEVQGVTFEDGSWDLTLREYLDQTVAVFQTGDQIGKQNGDVFHERGYTESGIVTYDLCGSMYGSADVYFTAPKNNPIVLDFVNDAEILDPNLLHMDLNDGMIDQITYDNSDSGYSFYYDEDGLLTEYTNGICTYSLERNEECTTIYCYECGYSPKDYNNCWIFDNQGAIYSVTHIEGSGMTYEFNTFPGDGIFRNVKEVKIIDGFDGSESIVSYE